MTTIKLIIFDLDGVLVEAKNIHFDALNEALGEVSNEYKISKEEHLKTYDGLSTYKKLEILTETKNLDSKFYEQIWKKKQEITSSLLSNIKVNQNLVDYMKKLKSNNIKIVCCSNSIEKTVKSVLKNLGIIDYFDEIYSNENVENPKPHPEIFWLPMIKYSIQPNETVIIEDSPVGRLSAKMSGANTVLLTSQVILIQI